MNREEAKKLMAVIRAAYPSYYRSASASELADAVDLWAVMFDEPAEQVAVAVKAYIAGDERGFPPSIGQIKAKLRAICAPEQLPETAAWALVRKAIADSIYHANEQFDALPANIRACVTPALLREWAMDEHANEQVIASNFMRSYRQTVARRQELDALPQNAREFLKKQNRLTESGQEDIQRTIAEKTGFEVV